MAKQKKIKVQLVRSPIGRKPKHRATVKALGLRKINQTVEVDANPVMKGMIDKVSYLLKVEEA